MSTDFKSVRDCAEVFIEKYNELSNTDIAKKVSEKMKSQTTAGCISWYKSKLKSTVKISSKGNVNNEKILDDEEEFINDYEEQILDNEAEAYFYDYISSKTNVKNISKEKPGVGYDFKIILEGGKEMHVEVKSKKKGKISWLQLTSRETEALLNDRDFYLCLIDQKESNFQSITIIGRNELFRLMKIKLHARLNGLSAEKKRDNWDITNYF
jgi:hypothetical protein